MRWATLFAFVVLLPSAAASRPIDYRCPATWRGDDGRDLVLVVERTTGVWRVDEPVPFVLGSGRFWRLVCSYRDPAAPAAGEVEALVHWVDVPHEDGRMILEDVCADAEPGAEPPAGVVRSRGRQAKARAVPAGAAAVRLAREMLAAVESAAPPCPGTPGAPRVCGRWEVEEVHGGDRKRLCTWIQGTGEGSAAEPDAAFRYLYQSQCRFGGFLTSGTVARVAAGRFERALETFDGTLRYVYEGDFEGGGPLSGRFHWVSPDGVHSPEMDFHGRCVEQ
ncbi:MAG TPA: hypothetical protein VGG06_08005 [Thermoanaerobaculia bacterium]|jgi:hypothetical protein